MRLRLVNADDMGAIFSEAKALCDADETLRKVLGDAYRVLISLLSKLAGQKPSDKEQMFTSSEWSHLEIVLLDTLPGLPKRYLESLLGELRGAIGRQDDAQILQISNALATDLIERGWSLASLHAWVSTEFLSSDARKGTFDGRLTTFATRVTREPEEFEVILNLSGSAELQTLGQFCGFTFSPAPPDVPDTQAAPRAVNLEKFLRTNKQRSFARTVVKAVDQFSAAHAAVEKIALCQDRLRFNFSPVPVNIWKSVLVTRISDMKKRLVPLVFGVPNPNQLVPMQTFLATSRRLDALLASNQVDDVSRTRIEAAARHCRLGADGRGYQDMLLSWWMGLETLTSPGEGKGIGARVFKNAVPIICHNYFKHQLHHLGAAVKAALESWPTEVCTLLAVPSDHAMSWRQLLQVMQHPTADASVRTSLSRNPWLDLQWAKMAALAAAPAKLRDHLIGHATRVRWHLMRLYRIRCCLVHGTPIAAALQLPAANLEFYLRELILVVIGAMQRAPQLTSVEQVYQRAQYAFERRSAILGEQNAGAGAVVVALESELTFGA